MKFFTSRWCLAAAALVLTLAATSAAQVSPPSEFGGRWETTTTPGGGWVFDLTVSGDMLTGAVWQHGGEPGPSSIYDGKITGKTLTFKSNSPAFANIVTFKGTIEGDEIVMTRSVEVHLRDASLQGFLAANGVFGGQGPNQFVIARTGPVPIPAVTFVPVKELVDPSGRWESLRWNLDLFTITLIANGPQLTGTVSLSPSGGAGRQEAPNTANCTIFDGVIDGNEIRFKCKSPDNARTLTFTGKMHGDELAVTRAIELSPGGAVGNSLYGAYGVSAFDARRVSGAPTANDPSVAEIVRAQTLWAKRPFKQYEFTATWHCYCPYPSTPLTFRVNGDAAAALPNPSVVGFDQMKEAYEQMGGTVDRLFDLLKAAAAQHLYSIKVTYHSQYGYPTSVEIHPVGISTNDDLFVTIGSFRILD